MSRLEESIVAAIEARTDRIVQTVCDLVSFPSIVKADPREAGPGERDCQTYIQRRSKVSDSPPTSGSRTVRRCTQSTRDGRRQQGSFLRGSP